MWTWKHNDLGDHPNFGGDFEAALGAFPARTIILNADTDSYSRPSTATTRPPRSPAGESRPIPTSWGHIAPFDPRPTRGSSTPR